MMALVLREISLMMVPFDPITSETLSDGHKKVSKRERERERERERGERERHPLSDRHSGERC